MRISIESCDCAGGVRLQVAKTIYSGSDQVGTLLNWLRVHLDLRGAVELRIVVQSDGMRIPSVEETPMGYSVALPPAANRDSQESPNRRDPKAD